MQIEIPAIRDNTKGYDYLLELCRFIIENPDDYFDFNFNKCAFLDQNAVAILGGLVRYIDAYRKSKNTKARNFYKRLLLPPNQLTFQIESMSQTLLRHLTSNQFLPHITKQANLALPREDSIGYKQHMDYMDTNEIADHLNYHWLSDERISISPTLKQSIVSRMLEIFLNAYGHGVEKNHISGLGVTSCGQYFKNSKKLKLTVVDFGCGIISNVKTHFSATNPNLDDASAMKWALEMGNSTKTDSLDMNIPRGLGLDLLRDFVRINGGTLSVYSNSCCAKVDKKGNYGVSELKNPFAGTIVNIAIICDDRHYKFISEPNGPEQFF